MPKRLFIFSFYDKDDIVDQYVLFFLEELAKVGDIIFVADNDLSAEEVEKLQRNVMHVIAAKHGEYDFGSYKFGLTHAIESYLLDRYDWVILCNDSVYGPFFPLSDILAKIEKKNPSIWGFTKNTRMYADHLQSYFISMSKEVFCNQEVRNFFCNIKKEPSKEVVVRKYEIGFSLLIQDLGYHLTSYFDWDENFVYDPQNACFFEMIENGFPFLKRNLLRENVNKVDCLHKYLKIREIAPDYPFSALQKNLMRVVGKATLLINFAESLYRRLIRSLMFRLKRI